MNKKSIALKATIISVLGIGLVSSATGSIILNSGKDGLNGVDGQPNSIKENNGKIEVDNLPTGYDNVELSGMIEVSSNNIEFGSVSSGGRFKLNSIVRLDATPNKGYVFTRWENEKGELISTNPSIKVKAIKEKQNYVAIFDIDKENVTIEVRVRKDASLPKEVSIEGGGAFKYGSEYKLSVDAPSSLDGTFLYYEVNKVQFETYAYKIDFNVNKAVASGKSVAFDVNGVDDKYYLVAYKEKEAGDITIVVSSDIDISSSHSSYADAYIQKVNDVEYEEGKSIIFPGDKVTVKAAPKYLHEYSHLEIGNPDFFKIYRASFLYWLDTSSNNIVSYEEEYTFIAKSEVNLQAVFIPKSVVYVEGEYLNISLITKDKTYTRMKYDGKTLNDPVASFEFNEEVLLYCASTSLTSTGFTDRYNKFYLEISYDGTNYRLLSYDKQCYFTIPEDTPFIYIRAKIDPKSL